MKEDDIPDRLAIYRTEFQDASVSHLIDLGQRIFEIKENFQLSETNSGRVLRSGQRMVELATASGGVWAADEAQLLGIKINRLVQIFCPEHRRKSCGFHYL